MPSFSNVPPHVFVHASPLARAKLREVSRALRNALRSPSQFSIAKSKLPNNARYLVRKVNVTPRHLPKNRGGKYTVYQDPITSVKTTYNTIQNMLKNGTRLQKQAKLNAVRREMKANVELLPYKVKNLFNGMLRKKKRSGKVHPF
jgi:hypothetical protein